MSKTIIKKQLLDTPSKIDFRNNSLSNNSKLAYTDSVKNYYKFLENNKLQENIDSLKQWLETIDTPSTYNLRLQAIKEHLIKRFTSEPPERQLELRNALDSIKGIRLDKTIKQDAYITYKQVEKMAENANDIVSCFVLGLFWTGCRISELMAVKLKHCRLGDTVAIRIIGKGKKEREVYMSRSIYLQITETFKSQEYLFEKKNKKAKNILYTREHITKEIKKESVRILGIEITAHTLRHSKAMFLKDKGFSADQTAKALGHSSVVTTLENYYHGQPTPEDQGIQIFKKEK